MYGYQLGSEGAAGLRRVCRDRAAAPWFWPRARTYICNPEQEGSSLFILGERTTLKSALSALHITPMTLVRNGEFPLLQEELAILLQTSVDATSRRALKPGDTAIRQETLAL